MKFQNMRHPKYGMSHAAVQSNSFIPTRIPIGHESAV